MKKLKTTKIFAGTALSKEELKKLTGGAPTQDGLGDNTWLCSCGTTITMQSVYGNTALEAKGNMDTSNCAVGAMAVCYPYA